MKKPEKITCFGASFIDNIIPSILEEAYKNYKNDKRTNLQACAIIIFTCVSIESMENRIFYFKGKNPKHKSEGDKNIHHINILKICDKRRKSSDLMRDCITEIFCLRDAIMHNHLHEVDSDANSQLIKGYGDNKLIQHAKDGKTIHLGLNVRPDKINLTDAIKALLVFELLIDTIQSITKNNFAPWNKTCSLFKKTTANTYNFHEMMIYYFNNLEENCKNEVLEKIRPLYDVYNNIIKQDKKNSIRMICKTY